MNNDEHRNHYVEGDWGTGNMFMRPSSFMAATAALFSTFQDSPRMNHESATYWHEYASNHGMVML